MAVIGIADKHVFLTDDYSLPGQVQLDADAFAVPHTLGNARSLDVLSVDGVKSPIVSDYDFRFVVDGQPCSPMSHQIDMADFAILKQSCFILSDPGTGKTSSLLWAWHYLHSIGEAGRLAVFCPRQVIYDAWYADTMRIMPHIGIGVARGDKAERERVIRNPHYKIVVTNHDSISFTPAWVGNQEKLGFTHAIFDEATAYGDPSSSRFKNAYRFSKGKVVWVVTATPITQGPQKAWSLCQLVNPASVPGSYTTWKNMTTTKWGLFDGQRKPLPQAKALVHKAMQPAVRWRKNDCMDLPGVVYLDRDVGMSSEQHKFSEDMRKKWVAEDAHTPVTAATAAVKLLKLMQCYSGDVKADDGTIVRLDTKHKMNEVKDIIENTEGKVIVFANFIASIDRIASELEASAVIRGETTDKQRREIITRFQDPDDPLRVLVCHPKTAAHGLTLTSANAIVWWTPVFEAEYYVQGNERTDRPGQTRKTTVYNLITGTLDREIYRGLKHKINFQNTLLQLYASFRSEAKPS